LEHDLINILTG